MKPTLGGRKRKGCLREYIHLHMNVHMDSGKWDLDRRILMTSATSSTGRWTYKNKQCLSSLNCSKETRIITILISHNKNSTQYCEHVCTDAEHGSVIRHQPRAWRNCNPQII